MTLRLVFHITSLLWLTTTMASGRGGSVQDPPLPTTLEVYLSKPGCPEKCGNVTIPYPFGIGRECSADQWYTIVCRDFTNPPTPFLSNIDLEVLEIFLDGRVMVNQEISPLRCSEEQTTRSFSNLIWGSPFTYSKDYNAFVVVGCQNVVWLRQENLTVGGCMAICDDNSSDLTCNGVNCCQTTVPSNLQALQTTYRSIIPANDSYCGYAFLVDQKWFLDNYQRYRRFLGNLTNPFVNSSSEYVPLVIEWEFNKFNSSELIPKNVKCQNLNNSYNSTYFRSYNGYNSLTNRCSCKTGFKGNPYLPEGCQDIDECREGSFCVDATCINMEGFFMCQNPDKKTSPLTIVLISIGAGLGVLLLLSGTWWSYKVIKRRNDRKRREKFFKHNGGLLLEQQMSSSKSGVEITKMFNAKELEQATDHYSENRVLGRGGQGTVYKGMLSDGRIVAVKKSKKVDEGDLEVFINEVVILSQINHRNIVQLLGCCLETEVPLLVYEFIPNGTLFEHIHGQNDQDFPLTWELRLRIATEIAGALSYLHSAASVPIYHRDIKSTNILLDDKYRAKVADFGTSRSVAVDQTHLTTRVLGTFGYLDPEYFQSSQFTEKSDVYSFGVVVVELLTGQKAISSNRSQEARSLATNFLQSVEENRVLEIIDSRIITEASEVEIMAVAHLARRCLNLTSKKRPTMKEVAVELEEIKRLKEGYTIQLNDEDEDADYLSINLHGAYDFDTTTSTFDTGTTHSSDVQPFLSDGSRN